MDTAEKRIARAEELDFGDYCLIEQKRFGGVANELYLHKVIGRLGSNTWRPVPVVCDGLFERGDITEVVRVICCGVSETHVETFRLQDVKLAQTVPPRLAMVMQESDRAIERAEKAERERDEARAEASRWEDSSQEHAQLKEEAQEERSTYAAALDLLRQYQAALDKWTSSGSEQDHAEVVRLSGELAIVSLPKGGE